MNRKLSFSTSKFSNRKRIKIEIKKMKEKVIKPFLFLLYAAGDLYKKSLILMNTLAPIASNDNRNIPIKLKTKPINVR